MPRVGEMGSGKIQQMAVQVFVDSWFGEVVSCDVNVLRVSKGGQSSEHQGGKKQECAFHRAFSFSRKRIANKSASLISKRNRTGFPM